MKPAAPVYGCMLRMTCSWPVMLIPVIVVTISASHACTDVGSSHANSDLLPFGADQGDSNLQESGTPFLIDLVSPTFRPPYRFPACDALQQNIYFTDNGLIVMYNGNKDKYGYPRPTENSFSDTLSEKVFIAPYFSDVNAANFSSESNVYYQVYDRSEANTTKLAVLNTTSETINGNQESNFSVDWMLVITWDRVQPEGDYSTNTFQAVVATDGRRGYTVFNYRIGGMCWNFDLLPPPLRFAIIGYQCPDGTTTYIQDSVSGDPMDILERPDRYTNTNQTGVFVYRLDSNPESYINPEQECEQWIATQPDPSTWLTADVESDDCPCTGSQAMYDSRFEPLSFSLNLTGSMDATIASYWAEPEGCFYRKFKSSGSPGSLCCYNHTSQWLKQFPDDVVYGTVMERYSFNPFYATSEDQVQDDYLSWIEKEAAPRYYCCIATSQSAFCDKYNEKRPSRTCSSYRPPNLAWCLGDPHFTTLDKVQYTFNGRGEYILLTDMPLQSPPTLGIHARATYWTETSDVSNATYFTSFALRYKRGSRIEFRVNASGTGFTVKRQRNEVMSPAQVSQGFVVDSLKCMVKQKDYTHIEFSCPDGLSIIVGVQFGAADLLLSLPEMYKAINMFGLFGIWDGDPSNDFAKGLDGTDQQVGSGPNGTLVDSDFFKFGQTWQLQNTPLFSYEAGETYSTMNSPVTSEPSQEALLQGVVGAAGPEIRAICGDDSICIFDSLVTNSSAFGLATKHTNDANKNMQAVLLNFPPNITTELSDVLEVFLNKPLTLVLSAEDRDDDEVTFTVFINEEPHLSIPNGGAYNLTLENSDKVQLKIVADDGRLQSSITPAIKLCTCSSEAFCNYSQLLQDTNLLVEKFAIVSCDCSDGLAGPTCSEDFNPCFLNPCFPGVPCVDQSQPSQSVTCESCPFGYSGDGFFCQEIVSPMVTTQASVTEDAFTTADPSSDGQTLPPYVIAIICIVCIAVIVVLVGILIYLLMRKENEVQNKSPTEEREMSVRSEKSPTANS